ncbi:MAG: hypothetical protein HRU40_13635, partial [Saprospiraceae bacterium]|nr:hypothetical protein [Saprospiraceae bacterium]
MKRLFIPFFLILWLCYDMQAQDEFTCPRLYIGETIAAAGDTVTLAVRADDLREMIGLQTKITWDTTQVRLLDITHFNLPNLGSNNFTPISAANPMGAVTMSWFSAFLEPLDLPDSTALFSLCFSLHPSFTGQTGIRFTGGSPTEIIYDPAHSKAAPIPTLIDGQIATMGPMIRLHETCVRNEGACSITRGTIRSTPAGGISPYTYIWSGPNGFSSNKEMLSELPAGIYQLTITDASGMHRTSTYEIQSNKEKPLNIQLEETCKTKDSVRIMLRNEINEEIAFLGSNGQSGYGQSIAFNFPTRTIYSVSATNNSGCTQIFDGITSAFCPKDAPEKNQIVIAARTGNNTDTVCLPVQLEVIQRIKEANLTLLWDSAQVSWSHWSPHIPASSVNVVSSSATIVIDTILPTGFHHLGAACFSLMDGPDTILAITGNQSTFTSTMDTLIVPSVIHGTIFRTYEPQPVNLYIPDTTVVNGSHFCLPIRTDDQQDIMGIQFALSWDNQALSFQGVQLDQLPPSTHSLYNSSLAIQEGILAVSWHNDEHRGIDLNKGATLLKVCFQTEGPEGVVPIKLNRSVLPMELIYSDRSRQDANISGGRIQKLELVFPGDTNADGLVDYRDLANLGYAFGKTGPPRA